MKRTDDNILPGRTQSLDGCSVSGAIKMGVGCGGSADPDAYAGIAGRPDAGLGRVDYYRPARLVTAIEPYDIGNKIEILRSINPRLRWSRPPSAASTLASNS